MIRYEVRGDWDVVNELKQTAIGKYTDELDIPLIDEKEDYLEDIEEDEE